MTDIAPEDQHVENPEVRQREGEGREVSERELEKFEAESLLHDGDIRSLVLSRIRAYKARSSESGRGGAAT